MKVIHFAEKNQIEKNIKEDVSFLLTNRKGDYLSFSNSNNPLSRYQGWFIREGQKLYKVIENLEITNAPPVNELRNYLGYIERERGDIIESFFLPAYYNSLFYETKEPVTLELILDIKESFDNREFGRHYKVFQEKELIVVEYSQEREYAFYLAILPNILDYTKIENWFKRHYQLDQKRNSPPFERYVFRALKFRASRIIFSASKEKEKAVQESRAVFGKIKDLKNQRKQIFKGIIVPEKLQEEAKFSYLCTKNSLDSLVFSHNSQEGIYAGLPWFFQRWSRDEAISLKALANFNLSLAKKILVSLMEKIQNDGRIPNITFGKVKSLPPKSADGTGWIFKRAFDFIAAKNFNESELKEVKKYLESSIKNLFVYHTHDDFATNGPLETWMDTQQRTGSRIEIQALRLNMYKLAYQFSRDLNYKMLERKLKQKVRKEFWNKRFLADGLGDFTIRPNIFLAAYIYPELLTKKEWIKCFENVLPHLWLKWGGLATIDKKSPLFINQYTGEDSKSYHSGDSWFYLNNLIALVLYRFDRKKFQSYISKILAASAREILWKGVIGHHGELSSAKKLTSEGSWVQAWSNALYLEAIDEIFSKGLEKF